MLPHAREGHVKLLGKIRDRGVCTAELLQNAPSGGVRERSERGIEVGILNHMVQYAQEIGGMQLLPAHPYSALTGENHSALTKRPAQSSHGVAPDPSATLHCAGSTGGTSRRGLWIYDPGWCWLSPRFINTERARYSCDTRRVNGARRPPGRRHG